MPTPEEVEIIETGWNALKATGLDPGDWMLMEWHTAPEPADGWDWNGLTTYSFKHRDSRLYIWIPSKWAKYGAGQDYSFKIRPRKEA